MRFEMCAPIETDAIMVPNNGIKSPATEDGSSTGTVGGNGRLKKGPWTSAEDAILVEYVRKHGEGNWNAVQRDTVLARCGKSCRLRWANHLRPDLKKGAFSPEEENLIIELHAKMGNKWARMAAEMPGRTDNEIKNYWNTRIKRRQRAGLPVYPPGLQVSSESQHKDNTSAFPSGNADAVQINNFEIPPVRFKNLEHVYPSAFLDIPGGGFLDIPACNFVQHSLHSTCTNDSMMHPPKRLRGPESSIFPDRSQYQIGSYVQNAQPLTYSSAYDHNSSFNQPSSSTVLASNHAVINGDPLSSSSEPTWAMKEELPSLQTQATNWGSPPSPLPPLESADALIQTPPMEHKPTCKLPLQNNGLLNAESQSQTRNSYNLMDESSQFIHEIGWEAYGELTSPIGHSSSSMFSDQEAAITGFSVQEAAPVWVPTHYNNSSSNNNNGDTSQMFSRPDLLFVSDDFGPGRCNSG